MKTHKQISKQHSLLYFTESRQKRSIFNDYVLDNNVLEFNLDDIDTDDNLIKVNQGTLMFKVAPMNPNEKATLVIDELVLDEQDGQVEGVNIYRKTFEFTHGHEDVLVDVTSTIQYWLLDPVSNLGFAIECKNCHVENSDRPSLDITAQVMKDSNSRRKRSTLLVKDLGESNNPNESRDCKSNRNNKRKPRCCRSPLIIDVEKFEAFDFIVQPLTFNAYMCQGRCPLKAHLGNSHAFIQTLAHIDWRQNGRDKDNRVPKTCCAASKFSDLPLLHVDMDNKHKLKVTKWRNAIADECRCV